MDFTLSLGNYGAVRMAGLCPFILVLPQAQNPNTQLRDKVWFSKVPPLYEEAMCDTFKLPMALD